MPSSFSQNYWFQKFLPKIQNSNKLAQTVVDCGALDALVICLEEFDPGVKEAAAWALGYIARHNDDLAQVIRIFLTKLA